MPVFSSIQHFLSPPTVSPATAAPLEPPLGDPVVPPRLESRLFAGYSSSPDGPGLSLSQAPPHQVLSVQLRDLVTPECNAMGVNPSGQLAMIAGRRHYILIDLNHPESTQALHPRHIRAHIPELQFNYGRENVAAVAVEKKVEIVDWGESGQLHMMAQLAFHAKAITDLSWHEHNTSLLATSGGDKHVNIWDYRTNLDVPVTQFSSMVMGATQAVWDRLDATTLASSHYGEIRLWDLRSPKKCKKYISAHKEQILALDYSGNRVGRLLSSSSDCTVKFWNVLETCREPRKMIQVPQAPVWKMRYTPFGEGVVTLCTKSLYNESHHLTLWNAHNLDCPVHTFIGHTDRVTEFCWRNRDPANGRDEFQLITWSKDHLLKIWPIGSFIVDKVGSPDDEEHQDQEAPANEVESVNGQPSVSSPTSSSYDVIEPTSHPSNDMATEDDTASVSSPQEVGYPMSMTESGASSTPSKSNSDPPLPPTLPPLTTDTAAMTSQDGIFRIDPPLSSNGDPTPQETHMSTPSLPLTANSSVSSDLDQVMASLEEHDKVPELKSSSVKQSRFDSTMEFWTDQATFQSGHTKTIRSKSMEETSADIAMELASSIPNALFAKPQPSNLREEIKAITLSSNVTFEKLDFEGQRCILLAKTKRHLFYLSIDFPDDYPDRSPPQFRSLINTSVPLDQVNSILSRLRRTAVQQADRNRRCLEMCVRQFEIAIDTYIQGEKGMSGDRYVSPFNVLGGLRDANVPFPRVSGARFCGFDKLVTFTCPKEMHLQVQSQGVDKRVPRTLSIISSSKESASLFQTPSKSRRISQCVPFERRISKNRMNSTGSSISEADQLQGGTIPLNKSIGNMSIDERDVPESALRVLVFNIGKIQPYDMELGTGYCLMNNTVHTIALINAGVAKEKIKPAAAIAWALVHGLTKYQHLLERRLSAKSILPCRNIKHTCSCPLVSEEDCTKLESAHVSAVKQSRSPLSQYRVGKRLLEQRIVHLLEMGDIPTVASLLCVLDPPPERPRPQMIVRHKISRSECQVDKGRDAALEFEAAKLMGYLNPRHYSDSNSAAHESESDDSDGDDPEISPHWHGEDSLVHPKYEGRNDNVKKFYRGLLHSMGANIKATEVGKFIHFCEESPSCRGKMVHNCTSCGKLVQGRITCPQCTIWDRYAVCSVCQTFTKGLSVYCMRCGHGGHIGHIRQWFQSSRVCPAGCNCHCRFSPNEDDQFLDEDEDIVFRKPRIFDFG